MISLCLFIAIKMCDCSLTYRAAVVEFPFVEYLDQNPNIILKQNAKRYLDFINEAAVQKADIIIFPEYGLTTWAALNCTRETIKPFLQFIPPISSWNPCLNPVEENAEILTLLSCWARSHSMTVVVNLLTLEECGKKMCQYNTNVIFARNGSLVGTYHKHHLFLEEHFLDVPLEIENVVLDVGFAKFGTLICFDIDFYNPALKLVVDSEVKNIIFTTSWNSELPFALASQLYSSWARGLGVNFLASNYHYPQKAGLGSGIYSSQLGFLNETYDLSSTNYIAIADVPINPLPVPQMDHEFPMYCSQQSDTIQITSSKTFIMSDKPSSKPVAPINKIYYQSLQNFSLVNLHGLHTEAAINSGKICCSITYSLSSKHFHGGYYSLVAYDGLREYGQYKWPVEVCAVLWCSNNSSTCGHVPEEKITVHFNYVRLTGLFTTEAVLPSILDSGLQNIDSTSWDYYRKVNGGVKSKTIQATIESKVIINNVLSINLLGIPEE